MDVVMNEAVVELRVPAAKRSSSEILLHGVLFVVTVAIVVIGLRTHVSNGITAVNAVAFGLTLVWAVAALVANRFSDRTAVGPDPYALLIAADSLLAAVALTAGRLGQHESVRSFGAAKSVATIAALLVTAVSFHFLLALPDGQLPGTGRRTAVVVAYVAALATGVSLVIDKHALSILGGGISWAIAAVAAVIPLRLRYARAVGHDRERLQWFAIGVVLSGAIALVVAVLHVLINWPGPLGAVAAGSTVLVPVSLMASESRRLAPQSGRMLVRSFTVFGFVAMVSAIYLVVVLGLGHKPNNFDRPHDAGALDAGDRHRRSGLRAGPGALRGFRHPFRLRGQAGTRRGSPDLRQQADTGHTYGRAPAPAGRIPPQDHGTGECGGVHRHGRSPGAGRFRSRFGPPLPRRHGS